MTFQESFDAKTGLLILDGTIQKSEKVLKALARGDVDIVDKSWVKASVTAKKRKGKSLSLLQHAIHSSHCTLRRLQF